MRYRIALVVIGLIVGGSIGCRAGSQFRFNCIKPGQQEWGILLGYGGNHRIPSSVHDTFRFGVLKIRYGSFASRRDELGAELSYERIGGDENKNSVAATFAYRRYFLKRGSTALGFDAGIGGRWYDGKIRLLGTESNFTEFVGFTFQHGLGPSSALSVEYRFNHTSNAGTSYPNTGVNASSIGVGVSWYP